MLTKARLYREQSNCISLVEIAGLALQKPSGLRRESRPTSVTVHRSGRCSRRSRRCAVNHDSRSVHPELLLTAGYVYLEKQS